MITVQVKKNQIVASKPKLEPMTSGSQNVYPVQFLFSSEWAYLEKIAVFATEMSKDGPGSSVYNVLLDDNDRCFIPWEVNLSHSNHVYVGVYGTMNGNVVLPTAWADLGNVILGVTTGLDAEPPTPDIHDQILTKLSDLKADVVKYKKEAADSIAKNAADTKDIITKYQQDVTNYINKYQADTTAKIDAFAKEMTDLFEKTTTTMHDDALGKIAAIRNIVEDFTNGGLQVITNATIINKQGFPDKKIPTDTDGDGVNDKDVLISKFPRTFIMTNSTIASNADETSLSWSFLNEPVYVREGTYVDDNENVYDAIYVTDFFGTTKVFLTDDTGNFNDMISLDEEPIKYEDIVGTPDLSDVTRTKCIAVTLKADNWVMAMDMNPDEEDMETLSPVITQIVKMWGISGVQREQLIIPVPREDYTNDYYNANIMLVGSELNTLHFRAFNGAPDHDVVVYIYIINSTAYQWIVPPDPTPDDECCCDKYEFEQGLIEEEPNEEGKVVIRVDTVDTLDAQEALPMSVKGVKDIVGDIEALLGRL